MYTTIEEIRSAFWEDHPEFKSDRRTRKKHNDYNATIRSTFSMWKDSIHRDGMISDKHAQNATL